MSGQLLLEYAQQILVQVGKVLRIDAREQSNGRNYLEQRVEMKMRSRVGRDRRQRLSFRVSGVLIRRFERLQGSSLVHVVLKVFDRLGCYRVE